MAYTIGDLARISGNAPPFAEDELSEGCLTIKPGTIYLGRVRWWQYTDDPKVIFCIICQQQVTNYYLAIDRHVQKCHTPDQI
jgi:hypothetical protein